MKKREGVREGDGNWDGSMKQANLCLRRYHPRPRRLRFPLLYGNFDLTVILPL